MPHADPVKGDAVQSPDAHFPYKDAKKTVYSLWSVEVSVLEPAVDYIEVRSSVA